MITKKVKARGKRSRKPALLSILQEADKIIAGARRAEYGPARESFDRIAEMWSAQLKGRLSKPITGHEVALMMVTFKVCREMNKHKRDNLVDIGGYAGLAGLCVDEETSK